MPATSSAPRPLALVTGASSGIGAQFARTLAADHDLLLVARRRDRLETLAGELQAAHPASAFEVVVADLSTRDGLGAVVDAADRVGRPVELLVNNAGSGAHSPFTEQESERIEAEILLDCLAVASLTRTFAARMVERGRGDVILLGSTAGLQPVPNMAVYAASKAFVISFGDALNYELRGTGVTVTTICPGGVETEFFDRAGAQFMRRGRLQPQQVVDAALRGVRRRRSVVIPGLGNKLGALGYRLVPRHLMVWGAERLVRAS